MSTKIEQNIVQGYQQEAFEQARKDYENYFVALEKHPRLLVGTEVPAIGKEGMERLKDSNDAKEWQEAVRSILVQEIREAAQTKMEGSQQFLQTVHASIDLFKNNPDLIPGVKTFNRQLADEFATLAAPYEIRQDGKLQGYSIPVQPIIDNPRSQQAARAQTAGSGPATQQASTPGSPAAPPAAGSTPVDPPQAGIPAKAGSSAEKEDFSTLFGTIGLPHLQI